MRSSPDGPDGPAAAVVGTYSWQLSGCRCSKQESRMEPHPPFIHRITSV